MRKVKAILINLISLIQTQNLRRKIVIPINM